MSFSKGLEKTAFIGALVRGVMKASGGPLNFGMNAVQAKADAQRFTKQMVNAQKRGAEIG